ncbi:MAG: SDR family oxidoreductase [Cyanobacteria bacterium P01_A01_bin.37]
MADSTRCRALVTGASSGIGRSTALAFAKAGMDLALIGRSQSRLADVAEAAQQYGADVKTYAFDLSQIQNVKAFMEQVVEDCGNVDVLVNNAGMGYTATLSNTPLDDWTQVITLNLTSVFQCIQGILPHMRGQKKGTIINIASIAGHQFFPEWGAYGVSKAGLIALSKTLAAEERGNGIRVVIISPGAVNTPIWDTDTVQADFNRDSMLTPDIVASSIVHAATMPSNAVVDEMFVMPSAGAL